MVKLSLHIRTKYIITINFTCFLFFQNGMWKIFNYTLYFYWTVLDQTILWICLVQTFHLETKLLGDFIQCKASYIFEIFTGFRLFIYLSIRYIFAKYVSLLWVWLPFLEHAEKMRLDFVLIAIFIFTLLCGPLFFADLLFALISVSQ